MKKATLLFAMMMMFLGLSAQASIGTDDCPIRNLRKSLQLTSTGTAYYPKGHPLNLQRHQDILNPGQVYREN